MFFADYHVHSQFSYDCDADMEKTIKYAIAKGLQEIAFTAHVDFDYPDPNLRLCTLINYDKYLETFNTLKNRYKKDINILLGIELGLQPQVVNKIDQLLFKYPFDFVIGSTHTIDNCQCIDDDFFRKYDQKNVYLRYLESVLKNIKAHNNFDVCGHLDFIVRYGPYAVKKLSSGDYSDIVDTILKMLIIKGHGIELNTSGFRYGLKQAHPSVDILKRYRELGGIMITVGSDAHHSHHLCCDFKIAYDMLKATGFKNITIYRQRKPYFIDIDNPSVKWHHPA